MKLHELNRLNSVLSKELKQEAISNFKYRNWMACLCSILWLEVLSIFVWLMLFIFVKDFALTIGLTYFRYTGFLVYFLILPISILFLIRKCYLGTYRVLEVDITEKEKRGILKNKKTSYWVKGHNNTWVKVKDMLFWENELKVGNKYFLLMLDDEIESVNLNSYFWGYMQSE